MTATRAWRLLAAVLIVLPLAAVAAGPNDGRTATWVLGSLAGVLALSLLVVQILLPRSGRGLATRPLSLHRVLGLVIAGGVAAHILLLYLISPDDISDALVLDAPTYSRLGVIAAFCIGLSILLTVGRRRLRLHYSNWRILHAVLAVAIVGASYAHALMIRGPLDGPVELFLLAAGLTAGTTVVCRRLLTLGGRRRGEQAAVRSSEPAP